MSKLMLQGPPSPPLGHVMDTHHPLGRAHTGALSLFVEVRKSEPGTPGKTGQTAKKGAVFFLSKADRFPRLPSATGSDRWPPKNSSAPGGHERRSFPRPQRASRSSLSALFLMPFFPLSIQRGHQVGGRDQGVAGTGCPSLPQSHLRGALGRRVRTVGSLDSTDTCSRHEALWGWEWGGGAAGSRGGPPW